MRLMREVRFCLTPPGDAGPVLNSWAGWPTSPAIEPFLVLRAVLSGPVDPQTGYMCNIALIDHLLRERAIPHLQRARAAARGTGLPAGQAVKHLWALLADRNPAGTRLESLELRTSPYQRHRADRGEPTMIVMTESFEFAASHRLFCRDLPDEDNRRIFGKCSNPNGHGHNYMLEISVSGQPDPQTGTIVDQQAFQRVVKETVLDRFDHRHLNTDCPEFADLNPTVENITRVIWDLLADKFAPARLHAVRVHETAKTYAEYGGQ